MNKLRKRLGLSLAVMISVGNYNAEAGMLARWLGLGSMSNASSLNTTAALVNRSSFGGVNASSTCVGDNQLSNNSVGAAGIGASSDGFLTAGDGKSRANIGDEANADIQRKDLGVTAQNKSSITPPAANTYRATQSAVKLPLLLSQVTTTQSGD
jgi:hypothetical protein